MDSEVFMELMIATMVVPIAVFLGLRILRYSYRGMVHLVYYLILKRENKSRILRGVDPLPYDLKFNDYKYDPDKNES